MQNHLRPLAIALVCLGLSGTANVGLPSTVSAGPNDGGVIVLHAIPYQSRDPVPLCSEFDLINCSDATVNVSGSSIWKWFVFGAFPSGSSPRVSGVTFGIDYDESTLFLLDHGACGDFELPTAAWPSPGEGTAVTWAAPRLGPLVLIYSFAGYEYYGRDTEFCLGPHPTQGGSFADDSVPSLVDPIAAYGCLGFNGVPGFLPCPPDPEVAACCFSDGSCAMLNEEECVAQGGAWIGPGSDCDSNPCPVPTQAGSWGAVKRLFR